MICCSVNDLKGKWLTYDKKAHRSIQKEKVSFFLGKRMPDNWPG